MRQRWRWMGWEKSAEAIVVWATGRRAEFGTQGEEQSHSMGVERQQGSGKQLDLFDEALKASL
ncbi:MAG TPA: hypothetical protein VM711_05880, partial [Sphingomicrobium sp.]|nr:hypothetical protein [Sphingomicrobium sp.]